MRRSWTLWVSSGVALEVYALATNRMPFTNWVRENLGIEPITPAAKLGKLVVISGMGWGAAHLATGKYTPPFQRLLQKGLRIDYRS